MIIVLMCHQVKRAGTLWAQWLMVQQRKLVSALETDWSGSMESWCQRSHTLLSAELYESSFLIQIKLVRFVRLYMCVIPAVCLVLSWRRVGTRWRCLSLTVRVSVAMSGGKCPSFLWWQNVAASPTFPRPCTWLKDSMDTGSCWDKRSWQALDG